MKPLFDFAFKTGFFSACFTSKPEISGRLSSVLVILGHALVVALVPLLDRVDLQRGIQGNMVPGGDLERISYRKQSVGSASLLLQGTFFPSGENAPFSKVKREAVR